MGWLDRISRDIRFRIWVATVIPTSFIFVIAAFAVGSTLRSKTLEVLETGQMPVGITDHISLADAYIMASAIAAALASTAITLFVLTLGLKRFNDISGLARVMATGNYAARSVVQTWDSTIVATLSADINALAESLERIEKLRRDLVANLAHEIRTPLTNLQGYLEALRDGVIEPRPEALASVHEEVMRLVRLVDALHHLARADAMRNQPTHKEPRNLDSLLEQLIEVSRPHADAQNVRLQVESGAAGRLIPVHADSIMQVMQNLVKNAILYTNPGGTILVQTAIGGNVYSFSCINSGAGIPPEDLPHIFKRFYRTEKADYRALGGVGLGLAIAKELVQAHGGRMGANSKSGWTTIWFELPLEPALPVDDS